MSNNTCLGPGAMPDLKTLPIPQNITFGAIPGRTVEEPMMTCCEPNPVHIADGCYQWCELPKRFTNNSAPQDVVTSNFLRCLRRPGDNVTGGSVHMASGTGKAFTTIRTAGLVVWALLVTPAVLNLV